MKLNTPKSSAKFAEHRFYALEKYYLVPIGIYDRISKLIYEAVHNKNIKNTYFLTALYDS